MFAGEGAPGAHQPPLPLSRAAATPPRACRPPSTRPRCTARTPTPRPDIYGRTGNSGVSIATLDDMKKLYSGFDLCAPTTSVSMTINGPAPMILAMFMNTAIDQRVERYLQRPRVAGRGAGAHRRAARASCAQRGVACPAIAASCRRATTASASALLGVTGDQLVPGVLSAEYARIRAEALAQVRGTVQADILKEDQAQNTCIFSTEFALRMMGDVQQYFIDHKVRNFYSVSISGYHIAEAGANPITQLAFTLANGFTIVEYYLARGMKIDDFAPNLSFFFSNGMDAGIRGHRPRGAAHLGARDARAATAAAPRSQMLKYHIQTSGRSLHAQEIQFNDIRTTLQALYALFDNCNSLHTNAYDEAITTPTEESVRRAVAIQLIINRELGPEHQREPLAGLVPASNTSPTWSRRPCTRSSTRSPSAAACSARWRRCTSAARSRKRACTTRQTKHDGSAADRSASTPSSSGADAAAEHAARRADPLDRGGEAGAGRERARLPGAQCRALRRGAGAAAAASRRGGGNVFGELMRGGQGLLAGADLRARSTRSAASTGATSERAATLGGCRSRAT